MGSGNKARPFLTYLKIIKYHPRQVQLASSSGFQWHGRGSYTGLIKFAGESTSLQMFVESVLSESKNKSKDLKTFTKFFRPVKKNLFES